MHKDLEKLQGTWYITALEIDGTPMTDVPSQAKLVIKGNSFTSLGMGEDYSGTVEIDATKSPRAIDLVFTAGPEKGNRNRGIYTIAKDRWTLCLATKGTRRPRTFATRAGTGIALETLARTRPAVNKPAAKKAGPKRTPPAPTATGPATELEGTWQMTAAVFDGAPMAHSMVVWVQRVTHGDVTTVAAGPQLMLKASFRLDTSTTPNGIEYTNLAGTHKGKKQAGIYALDGDSLRICMAPPGKPRPAEFASTRGDGRSFTTWVRA